MPKFELNCLVLYSNTRFLFRAYFYMLPEQLEVLISELPNNVYSSLYVEIYVRVPRKAPGGYILKRFILPSFSQSVPSPSMLDETKQEGHEKLSFLKRNISWHGTDVAVMEYVYTGKIRVE